MKTTAQLAKAALAALTTPVEKSPASTSVVEWDWRWSFTGKETKSEKLALEEMLKAAKEFVADVARGGQPRWLSFLGAPGVGKTHLADRIRCYLDAYGRLHYDTFVRPQIDPDGNSYLTLYPYAQEGAIMAKWGRIISNLRDREPSFYIRARRDHYKIIDDLGVDSFDATGKVTSFAVQKMAELLDQRLRKWTVITSNYGLEKLAEHFDPRIASRMLRDGNVVVDVVEARVRDFNIRGGK